MPHLHPCHGIIQGPMPSMALPVIANPNQRPYGADSKIMTCVHLLKTFVHFIVDIFFSISILARHDLST